MCTNANLKSTISTDNLSGDVYYWIILNRSIFKENPNSADASDIQPSHFANSTQWKRTSRKLFIQPL
jgi:hypothetical protein